MWTWWLSCGHDDWELHWGVNKRTKNIKSFSVQFDIEVEIKLKKKKLKEKFEFKAELAST